MVLRLRGGMKQQQQQLFLKGQMIPTRQVSVDPAMTVLALKKMIYESEGIPTNKQRLIFVGKQLLDEKTLGDYNIREDSTLQLLLALKGGMQIYIKSLSGAAVTLTVEPSDTIWDIKKMIEPLL